MIIPSTRRVAIVGNPNTGKSSVFNALTGLTQKVGNYPGVTVEKKIGSLTPDIELIDLPGMYSLAAHSPDEMLAVQVLLGEREDESPPDLVVVIVDATNLQRNLYLVTQVMEVGLPTIVALNMIDLAEKSGISINARGISKALGIPVVTTIANRKLGAEELRNEIVKRIDAQPPKPLWRWPESISREIKYLEGRFQSRGFLLTRALIDEGGAVEELLNARFDGLARSALDESRGRIRQEGSSAAALEAEMRHRWIGEITAPYVQRKPVRRSATDRIDDVLVHKYFGMPIFVITMAAVFISVFMWATPFMDLIIGAFHLLGVQVSRLFEGTSLAGGALESLIVDGAIAGVGGVIAFLPQIAFLFLFIAILEDCGYMARAAFLMDRMLRFCGLGGMSFIPMLTSFACAVPGILATRTISDTKDRLTTILVAPFMSCSARIPVYVLMIAAFIPPAMVAGFLPLQGLVFGAMYFVGIAAAVPAALLLKRTFFSGSASTFVMELPTYKAPSLRGVFFRIYDRVRTFLRLAGTIIFAISIVVWALGYFPRPTAIHDHYEGQRIAAQSSLSGEELASRLHELDKLEKGAYLRQSFLGQAGKLVAPAVRPLGWDWKIGMATIASFPAREVIVSTLNIIYDLGDETEGEQEALIRKLDAARWPDGSEVFTLPVALSIMVFFALCCQCGATLAAIRRETGTWKWPAFTFAYMTVLAYLGALVTYQIGSAIAG